MAGDVNQERPEHLDLRVSDADRERVADQLRVAAGDGRLTFDELDERLDAAYRARTYRELEPLVADLPKTQPDGRPVARRETMEIRQTGSSIDRRGRWVVPRRLVVTGRLGSTRLDFSEAVIDHDEVEIVLDTSMGSTKIIVPEGAVADTDELAVSFGSCKNKAATTPAPGTPRFRLSGSQSVGSIEIRQAWTFRIGRLTIHYPWRLSWRRDGG